MTYNNGSPLVSVESGKEGYNYNTYAKLAGAVNKDKAYYISVLPGEFTQGFTFEIEIAGEKYTKSSKSITLKRNGIIDLGTVTFESKEHTWTIIGDFNDWSDDIATMTLEDDWYVARNIAIANTNFFKFRADKGWDISRGGVSGAVSGEEYAVSQTQDNITVAESGYYDVYLSKDTYKMKVDKVADYTPEVPEDTWGIVGSFNAWNGDIVMTEENGLYVAKNVTFDKDAEFKIRKNGAWGESHGVVADANLQVGYYYTLGSENAKILAGTYDIWLDITIRRLYVMSPGQDILSAKEYGKPVAEEGYLYFKPNSNWLQAGARFALYFFNNEAGTNTWVDMTAVEGCPGYFKCFIPTDKEYPTVIF